MKTLQQIKRYKEKTMDGRDMSRLIEFIPEADLADMEIELKPEYVGKHQHSPLTRENVLKHLESDLAFAFEKALDKRGISAGWMRDVVLMWVWVLDDELPVTDYAQYGLPTLKAVALKYGFDNPIGDDEGNEDKYASD